MKISAKTLIIGISTLVVAGGSVAYYLTTQDSPETLGWMNSSWLYRRGITVENEGDDLLYEDVLIEVDTASLVSANKLQSDCDDLRFTNGDGTTGISYWVEGGCNTSTTQIWVQIPEIRTGELTIYMYYGNTEAINAEESWNGDFIVLSTSSCPSGWTRASAYDDKYTYGSDTYGTTFAGTHNHGQASGTTGYAIGGTQQESDFDPEDNLSTAMHTAHNHANTKVSVNNTIIEPLYVGLYFCISNSLSQFTNSIGIFNTTSTTLPTGYTYYSALEGKFPRGSSSPVTSGGSSTHTHTTTGGYVTNATAVEDPSSRMATKTNRSTAAVTHTHTTVNGTTQSGNNNTPYYDIVYGQTASNITASAGIIEMTSAVPPLGWTRFTSLDSKFPRGATTAGGSYSGATHTHSITITTGTGSASSTGVWYTAGTKYVDYNHTHTATVTSSAANALPAYITTIFAQRKNSVATTIGDEVTLNTTPNAPSSLWTEGQTNPSRVSDSTPEFSATFSDPDTPDTGNYYQIQVNTASDFMGTSLWDSTKTALSPVVTNGSRSQDISYAGSTLSEGTTYYWRMKFWDNSDAESSWSSTASFTMNTTPTAPTTLLTEGENNPTGIADTTPEFSAIFNDPNTGDTGVQYQIEVNTASDFTGTQMWDSTLTSMTSTAIGARSPDISYAGTTLALNGTTYYWRIKFADAGGLTSPWSTTGSFIMDGGPFAPTALLTDGMTNPTRIFSMTPSFSAIYTDPNGDDADIYQIQVNTNNTFTGTVMWDSGQQATSTPDGQRSEEITYAGTPLTNQNTTYYWRIKFWDLEDYEGPWSATAQFSSLQASFLFEGVKIGDLKLD